MVAERSDFMAKIRKIEQTVPAIAPRKKVAAYARVSVEIERICSL